MGDRIAFGRSFRGRQVAPMTAAEYAATTRAKRDATAKGQQFANALMTASHVDIKGLTTLAA